MPVRSRGSLLAGTAALAGLIAAGLGCHSSPSDHDSFSIPKTPPQTSSNFLSRRNDSAPRVGYPAQPVVQSGQVLPASAASNPVPLPVPITQAVPSKREVIASTWSPVQRVSAEVPVSGPDLHEGAPAVPVSMSRIPGRLPIGAPASVNNGPVLDGGVAAPPSEIVLPQPHPLGSPSPDAVVVDGALPPGLPHHQSVPREFEKMALPPYVVEPPDILLIQASSRVTLRLQPLQGAHLVGPDGTVNLGVYGKIRVAGMTLEQVGDAVAGRLLEIEPGLLKGLKSENEDPKTGKKSEGEDLQEVFRQDFKSVDLIKREMQVDVVTYNSKFYYVITDGGGYGQQVYPIPIRGNEMVLDALANINGLPAVASKKRVWVARATRAGQPPNILPVDWMAVTKCGSGATNYQLYPGDRVYVDSNHLIKADTFLSKLYSPILRTLGVTLLGASAVNDIKGSSGGGLGGGLGLFR